MPKFSLSPSRAYRQVRPARAHTQKLIDSLEPRRLLSAAVADVIAKATPYTADRVWTGIDALPTTETASERVSYLRLNAFEPFTLDASRLRNKLNAAGDESVADAGVGRGDGAMEISIPTPEGTLARFNIVESSIMAPELQAQFPDIRTYAGYGVDDPAAYVRLDFTPLGFHAMVMSPGSTFYVDPYYHLDQSVYASYYRRDSQSRADEIALGEDLEHVGVDHLHEAEEPLPSEQPTTDISSGTQLRTYRLANAATAEYTTFWGGTVPAGQAAIVTAVNRVTGVYEIDLSIRLSLVANNSNLVFTDTVTDGYTNNNPNSLLSQNQSKCDTVIGSANYDIGHVFSTGGGGLAGLGVVGVNGLKAQGETGLPSPVGDPFFIDFVAHEMGHQFGANHSFNTSSDPNRNASTAYEPGSGSTIMAYAGITGPNSDLQLNSDPYFHWISAQEIINRCDLSIPGVGTRTATGNSIPTVNAGTDFTIPTNTPFLLTGSSTDANGDTVTYCWEQADLGPAQLLNSADNGSSPLFRSLLPTTNPSRSFPNLALVLAGQTTNNNGERLPTLARAMDFRLSVRDNRAGGGGYNTDDMVVNVVNTGSAFSITSFNSASTVTVGSAQTLTWNVAGTTGSGINTANVKITMSTDGGNTFPVTLFASTPNDGTEGFTVPNNISTQVRFKVEAIGNIFYDISNANTTIAATAGTSATPGQPSLTAASDTGISNSDNITRLNNNGGGNVLSFSVPNTVAGATVVIIVDGVQVGSAVAAGTTTTVTTNGTQTLADGNRSFVARQTEPGKSPSNNSTARVVTVDATAPAGALLAFDRNVGPAHQLQAFFTENVSASLAASDLSLTNNFATSNGTASVSYNGGTNVATFTFPSAPNGGILLNGNYTAAIAAANVSDVAGNSPLAALGTTFSWLNGDANNDKKADIDDFGFLAANFNAPGNLAQGNFNYVGNVDIDDFGILAANFNIVLPASLARAGGSSGASPFSSAAISRSDLSEIVLGTESGVGLPA